MNYLYLDDIRKCPSLGFDLVRSYDEAVLYVKQKGIPEYISFDHDLGVDTDGKLLPTGYDFAKWLVEMDMNEEYNMPYNFTFKVHSANPVGKENIEIYLNNYFKYKYSKIQSSSKKVLFFYQDFSYNLFWSCPNPKGVELLMDDIIYKYLVQATKNNTKKLIELYGEDNVKRVLSNIKIMHGKEMYHMVLKEIDLD